MNTGMSKKIARTYVSLQNSCPELRRYFRSKDNSESKNSKDSFTPNVEHCPYCFNEFNTSNNHVRLSPRMKLTPSLKKLLKKAKNNWHKLRKQHQHLITLYTNSKNNVIVTCLNCKRSVRKPGFSRQEVQIKRSKIHQKIVQSQKTKKTNKQSKTNNDIVNSSNTAGINVDKTTISSASSEPFCVPSNKTKESQLSVILKSQSKKKKSKNLHQSLQLILSQERQRRNSSRSLKEFLSSLK